MSSNEKAKRGHGGPFDAPEEEEEEFSEPINVNIEQRQETEEVEEENREREVSPNAMNRSSHLIEGRM